MSIPNVQRDNPIPTPLPAIASGVTKPRRKPKPADTDAAVPKPAVEKTADHRPWYERLVSRQGWIGMAVSFFVHCTILSVLAFIVVSTASRESISVMGMFGDSDEYGGDVVLDTTLPIDPGDSSPMTMADMSQSLESLPDVGGVAGALEENIRVGLGGAGGDGHGGSGDGIGVAAPTLRIPSHAQTKGSFSAWTDPRDPKPNENYSIVIQIRLPEKIKKYRGSDLTGMVTGTDRYKQTIRFRYSEQFPVENGLVEIRIGVPGGALRVRDTIRIESKLLKEKQTFEIEF